MLAFVRVLQCATRVASNPNSNAKRFATHPQSQLIAHLVISTAGLPSLGTVRQQQLAQPVGVVHAVVEQ